MVDIKHLQHETKIKVRTGSTITLLELISKPSHAASLNGISEDDEYLLKGYVLTQKLLYSQKVKKVKCIIAKLSDIELI